MNSDKILSLCLNIKMLRRKPTSVTLTAMDIEMFKDILMRREKEKEESRVAESNEVDFNAEESESVEFNAAESKTVDNWAEIVNARDDIFMGKSITRKRRRDLETRIALALDEDGEELEEDADDLEETLFKRTRF